MKENNPPLVGIVVVGWNSANDLVECFESLISQDYQNYRLIYVDNNSSDNSLELVEKNFPEVTCLPQNKNLYFTGGHNVGMRHAMEILNCEFLGIINPDAMASKNWISSQVNTLISDQRIGVVGPKVLFANGFGSGDKISNESQKVINSVGIEPGGFLLPYDRGFGEIDRGQYNVEEEVYAVSGVSMMFRKEALEETGLFLEPMQMYLEDVELCLRIRELGYKVHFSGNTTVNHKLMQSTKQANTNRYLVWSRTNYLTLVSLHYPFKKLLRTIYQNLIELDLATFILTFGRFLKQLLKIKFN